MKRTSISTLKAKLSQFLDAVKAGEEVLVTDRGTPVARISPVEGEEGGKARMRELLRTGRVRPPSSPEPPDPARLPRTADPDGRALAALLEERAEGR